MLNSEMPSEFKRLAFLALIRRSQVHNSVTNNKLKLFKVGELAFISSRYGTEAMNKMYGSTLLPVVGNLNALNLRLFTFAHVDRNPLHNFAASSMLSDCHLPLDPDHSHVPGLLMSHHDAEEKVFLFPLQWSRQDLRPYSGDFRLTNFLGGSEVIFHTVSLDLFVNIRVLAHARSRAKPSYMVTILVATDIVSGALCLNTITDGTQVSPHRRCWLPADKLELDQQ